jgi:hypothetical protein
MKPIPKWVTRIAVVFVILATLTSACGDSTGLWDKSQWDEATWAD